MVTETTDRAECPGAIRMVNLAEMSPTQADEFARAVASSSGEVQMWVHSHDDEGESVKEINAENLATYLVRRDQMLTSSFQVGSLVIALIGSKNRDKNLGGETITDYEDYYSRYATGLGRPTAYYVQTLTDNSTPLLMRPEPDSVNTTYRYKNQNWDKFYEMLNHCGVRTVVLGGRNLSFVRMHWINLAIEERDYVLNNFRAPSDDGEWYVNYPVKCVGLTALNLGRRGMDIQLSEAIHTQSISPDPQSSKEGGRRRKHSRPMLI